MLDTQFPLLLHSFVQDTPPELDLMRLVFNQLQDRLIEIDVDFISELGFLYLNILSLSLLRNFQMP